MALNPINGTGKNDNLKGSDAADIILAGGGDDTVNAGAGDDTINGGTGNDTINGGSGNDTIIGGTDDDTLTGASGSDTFVFNFAVGRLTGEGGTEFYIRTSEGNDIIRDFDYRNHLVTSGEGGGASPEGGSDRLKFNGMSSSQYDDLIAKGHMSAEFTGRNGTSMKILFTDTGDSITLNGINHTLIADLTALKAYIDFGLAG